MKTSYTQTNQYSNATAQKFINPAIPVNCVTSFVETQYEYVEKQRTDNIKGYKLWFIQEGLNPFTIKFDKKPDLPPFLSIVEFENLQGIEIRSNVYFKADKLKVVK
ncbi:hypothetical protein CUM91_13050 [Enterococcus faecalis]|uniref:hypothetical protein n=1 Tax=Enterococcus faecalis TaxID=1351 RepID=UPI000CF71409|nr:hypothetical protein [Enterococcus faecalis]PQC10769.1 hypothetical protein CUM91_13050 [Enterococcus faecalis]